MAHRCCFILQVSLCRVISSSKQYDFEKELKSFVDIANEIDNQVISSTMHEFGLSFDKKFFKANKEVHITTHYYIMSILLLLLLLLLL